MAGGASDETLGKLARGKLKLLDIFQISPKIPALIMALPLVFATYSSFFLLVGTIGMVMAGQRISKDDHPNPYYYLPLIPIGCGFISMLGTVMICEAGAYQEAQIRRRNKERWDAREKVLLGQAVPISLVVTALLPEHCATLRGVMPEGSVRQFPVRK